MSYLPGCSVEGTIYGVVKEPIEHGTVPVYIDGAQCIKLGVKMDTSQMTRYLAQEEVADTDDVDEETSADSKESEGTLPYYDVATMDVPVNPVILSDGTTCSKDTAESMQWPYKSAMYDQTLRPMMIVNTIMSESEKSVKPGKRTKRPSDIYRLGVGKTCPFKVKGAESGDVHVDTWKILDVGDIEVKSTIVLSALMRSGIFDLDTVLICRKSSPKTQNGYWGAPALIDGKDSHMIDAAVALGLSASNVSGTDARRALASAWAPCVDNMFLDEVLLRNMSHHRS